MNDPLSTALSRTTTIFFLLALGVFGFGTARAQTPAEREVAAQFAPIFYQALGDTPRSDYITNFDFDGDWRGDNNWEHAADAKFPLLANIYYSVSETATHYFIHYALFHPRDYKGGVQTGKVLSEILMEGSKIVGKNDPTGLLDEATAAHENDMEGALVVVAKNGDGLGNARVQFVETLQHNMFKRYTPAERRSEGIGPIRSDGNRVLLYVEPKGHGIEAYSGEGAQAKERQLIVYKYAGKAEDPDRSRSGPVGYDLLPIQTTLWSKAQLLKSKGNETYGIAHDYSTISIILAQPKGRDIIKRMRVGVLGSAFLGSVGGVNMARPPWGWFDIGRRNDPLGLWFFDPAAIIKRDFNLGESFTVAYSHLPFWASDKPLKVSR